MNIKMVSGKPPSSPWSKRAPSNPPLKEQPQNRTHQGHRPPPQLHIPPDPIPSDNKIYHLPRKLTLKQALIDDRFNAASQDKTEDLVFNWNLVFNPPSRSNHFSNPRDPRRKTPNCKQAPFHGIQKGALNVMKVLLEKYGEDINFLQAPHATTSPYVVAAQNHLSILEYFLKKYKGQVDLDAASGKFANGATVL